MGTAGERLQAIARELAVGFAQRAAHWDQTRGGGVSKVHLIFARVLDERGEEQGIGGI